MIQMTRYGQVVSATLEGTTEYRQIDQQVVRLQERITHDRRHLDTLHDNPSSTQEDTAGRVADLQDDIAQHQGELDFYVSQRDQLWQPPHDD